MSNYDKWILAVKSGATTLDYPAWDRKRESMSRRINDLMSDISRKAELCGLIRAGLLSVEEAREYDYPVRFLGDVLIPSL